MYTSEYNKLLDSDMLSEEYKIALEIFIKEASLLSPVCIILYGGLARDLSARDGWSDVDLVLVFTDLYSTLLSSLSEIKKNITQFTGIELDINAIPERELENDQVLSIKYNAKFMNIFSGRSNVSIILYGQLSSVVIKPKDEKLASMFRINDAIFQFRKELIDGTYLFLDSKSIKAKIRRTNAIVRASLVAMGYYVHPYEDLINCLCKIFPDFDVGFLRQLSNIRNGNVSSDYKNLFVQMVDFLENYLKFINPYLESKSYEG